MDSGSALYEKLITQSKSNDVDVKVDALTKLSAQFERGGVEVPDVEVLVNVLKATLRTSNLHLTNAALSALPVILPAIISRPTAQNIANLPPTSSTSSLAIANNLDVGALRLALAAFLPPGGVIDRLGEKEKAQVKARETLVILGGYAFRASPTGTTTAPKASKGHEPPIAIFEKFLKEGGLASKVWKVREQSVLTLTNIRRAHHLFPIRPYLSLLVDCLEDTDSHVRDVARVSVVELFTGPGVSDAARADLKKEMAKKGVRKTIVDGVLAKLLGGSLSSSHGRETPENGDGTTAKKEYIPPSLALQGKRPLAASQSSSGSLGSMPRTVSSSSTMPRPASRTAMVSPPPPSTPTSETAEVSAVYIASAKDLENEFATMQKPFEGKETEHNWAARDTAIQRVRGMLKGEAHIRFPEPFFIVLKEGFMQWSTKTLLTLRTTVALNTCALYSEMAISLGPQLDPYVDLLLTNLLKMAGFTKKITAQQSQTTVTTIITHTSAQPRTILSLLWNTLQEKTIQSRAYVVGHLKTYIEVHGHRAKNAIEGSGMVETLEKSLKKALADQNPASREQARILFWVFHDVWPDRGASIIEGLDATARKQLEKVCPSNMASVTVLPTTPQVPRKTSVAAAIAASRAKAKAIATAPPSLRHQATSSSHMAAPRRAGSPSVSPKNSTSSFRPLSPQNQVTPVPRRVVSTSNARPTSTFSHHRTLSNGSSDERSTSPSLSDSGIKRRTSSPLVNNQGSATRKAAQVPLPPSPPTAADRLSPHRQIISRTPKAPLNSSRSAATIPVPPRPSLSAVFIDDGDSLLMAQAVPIPDDTDSDDGQSINLMSFSAPYEAYPPVKPQNDHNPARSPTSDSQTSSLANTLSSSTISDISSIQQPIVEDVLRGRAEQAESAAQRLLELVEPEDESAPMDVVMPSSRNSSSYGLATPKPKPKPMNLAASRPKAPITPNNRASAIMKQAALFQDSPAPTRSGRSGSLLDVLQRQSQESGWWLKRKILLAQPELLNTSKSPDRIEELHNIIAELEDGSAGVDSLKRLTLICMQLPAVEHSSPPLSPLNHPDGPPPLNFPNSTLAHNSVWEKDNTFDRFFRALIQYLAPEKAEDELTYGLIVVYEVLESQLLYIEGKEAELFAMIMSVRFSNKIHVLEGTNAIRDALASKIDPVYGLTTMHSSLKLFHSETVISMEDNDVKASTYAFGLMALGKFILRLPGEIAEEELPRLKSTLIASLNDKSSLIVREAAAAAIIAAQVVLQDETHLFTLLDGLADEKKNLLTYLFDKHGARGNGDPQGQNGVDKLEKEIRRLDTRTSTPLRGGL